MNTNSRKPRFSDLDAYLKLCELSDFKGRVNMGPYSTPEIISERWSSFGSGLARLPRMKGGG